MKKTNKRVYLYKPAWGWHRGFNRRIYEDDNGIEYVKMRGKTELDWVLARADSYQIDID